MHRYNYNIIDQQEHILKYPDLLTSLSSYRKTKLKCEGRILRRDTERIKKFRRRSNFRIRHFESALFRAMDQKPSLFICPVCRNLLKAPVTVECGHTYCYDCLSSVEYNYLSRCAVCVVKLMPQKRCINVLVQHLVEKWREKNKSTENINNTVPNTEDILGVEPRYRLRSGYAGLKIKNDVQERISSLLEKPTETLQYKKEKRKSKQTNVCNKTYSECYKLGNFNQFSEMVDHIFTNVHAIKDNALKVSWSCISTGDLECILCSRCLLDPVTTSCGHTFCQGCLIRVLDHGLSCPLCMASLNLTDYSRGTTEVLDEAIKFLVPREYDERMLTRIRERFDYDNSPNMPIFICTNAFPGVACPLYVFEPKYRLIARRCLQSNTKRFAMAGKDSNGEFVQSGTVLEIKDAVNLEDGRFILTTVGVRRFKIISTGEQDGYDTAQIEYIGDNDVPTEKLQELILLHDRVYNKASKWINSFKPKILAEVERLIGKMPIVEKDWFKLPDGPSWAWWLVPILPLSSQLQVGFLNTTSLEKRLRAIDKMLEHMKIRMKALERNTEACPQELDPLDYCGDSERSLDMPYDNN